MERNHYLVIEITMSPPVGTKAQDQEALTTLRVYFRSYDDYST